MSNLPKPIVAGIGEILWDVLENSEKLGGAPVNFAYHANSLGGQGYPISTVGDDKRGEDALAILEKRGMSTEYITTLAGAETGYVVA
ncbi:MAG: PfkB family carbohydrate kinase, partial [Desulforhopalus sp.]